MSYRQIPCTTKWCSLIVLLTVVAGCKGHVIVGTPQVFTRERLIQERVDEEAWLKQQLAKPPDGVSFQGIRDIRDFSGIHQELRATFDPAQSELFRLDHDITKTTKELELAKARHELRAYKQSDGKEIQNVAKDPAGSGSASPETSTLGEPPASTSRKIPDKTDELRSGEQAKTTKAQPGILDKLHDQLAFRNTVRAAMRERQLDDAHDLTGSAIYDFQFDVTLMPESEHDQYAKVLVKVNDPACDPSGTGTRDNPGQFDKKYDLEWQERYGSWKQAHEKLLNARILEIQQAYLDGRLTVEDQTWLSRTISIDLPNLQRLFIAIGKLLPLFDTDQNKYKGKPSIKFGFGQDSEFSGGVSAKEAITLFNLKENIVTLRKQISDLREALRSGNGPSNDDVLKVLGETAESSGNLELQQAISIFQDMAEANKENTAYLAEVLVGIKAISYNLASILAVLNEEPPATLLSNPNSRMRAAVLLAIAWGVFEDEQWLNATKTMRRMVQLAPPMIGLAEVERSLTSKGAITHPQIILMKQAAIGYQEFRKQLCERNGDYAVTKAVEPKEYAQNVSDIAAYENLLVQVASLRAILPQYGVKADTYQERVSRRQEYLQAILRKPLAIGFGEGQDRFGWILGPRFTIDSSTSPLGSLRDLFYRPSPVKFVHEPVRHTVRAAVALPAWVGKVRFCYGTRWLSDWFTSQEPSPDCTREAKSQFQLALPARADRWESVSRFLNPGSRHLQPTPTISYPDPVNLASSLPVIVSPVKDQPPTHKQHVLIRGKNLWRNPEVYLGQIKASSVSILSDMEGLYATFEFVDGEKIVADPRSIGDTADITVTTSVGSITKMNAVRVIEPSRSAIWPTATLRVPRLIADKDESKLMYVLNQPPNQSEYANLQLRARDASNPGSPWKVIDTPIKASDNFKRLEVCAGSKRQTNDPCSFSGLGGGTKNAFEIQVRLSAKLAVADPDVKDLVPAAQQAVVYFKTSNDAKGTLSAPANSDPLRLTARQSQTLTKYEASGPVSVSLPNYNNQPNLFLTAYPGLKQAIDKSTVQVLLRTAGGHTVVFPTVHQLSLNKQHTFLVGADTIADKVSVLTASPQGVAYEVFLLFEGGEIPVKQTLTIIKKP